MTVQREWWKEAVVYEIYPRSFQDADGDGVGDLQGVLDRLDHVEALGVDAVWLTPVYESPQVDYGYDVADYRAIDDVYGTMADWERLRDALHDRGIRLLMDLVLNHTSDQHEWFRRSRSNPEGPYGDFYHWVEGDPGEPPNNWESAFGGPAWSYDDRRGAWYLHLFDETQPDLNWGEPAVRRAVADVTEFWLQKGVDGFRLDVINLVSKPPGLPDGDPGAYWVGADQFTWGPDLVPYLDELAERTFGPRDAVTVGEAPGVGVDEARRLAGEDGPLDMVFGFEHVEVDHGEGGRWDRTDWEPADLFDALARWQERLAEGWWPAPYLENHDQPRSVSRFGDEAHRYASATALATLLLTLRGTPFLYQGQEVGTTNGRFERLADVRDVDAADQVRALLADGAAEAYEDVRALVEARSRDNARIPMQWSDAPSGGFTEGDPWLAVHPDHETVNVAADLEREHSVLRYYRELVALRDERDVLVYGEFDRRAVAPETVFAYDRSLDGERVTVLVNLADDPATVEALPAGDLSLVIANHDADARSTLPPYGARVYEHP